MNVAEVVRRGLEIGMVQIETEIHALAGFLAALRPRNVMEIGTDRGGVFYILTQIATGVKVSLDLPGGNWGTVPKEVKEECDRRMTDWSQNVILIRDDSHSPTALDAVRSALTSPLDFLFLDGTGVLPET